VTLERLLLAWLPVALWQAGTAYAWEVMRTRGLTRASGPGVAAAVVVQAAVAGAVGESVVLTLLASLWFDSLGHGAWWLLFVLLGLLQGLSVFRYHRPTLGDIAADRLRELGLGVARGVVAGGILAWRLG
jgi:hypothetical protein